MSSERPQILRGLSMKRLPKRTPRLSSHYADAFDLSEEEIGDASWEEVCKSCFMHSPRDWLSIFISLAMVFSCLYFFGLGLDFMGSGAKVMTACAAGELFGHNVNPIAATMVGMLVTVLLQSSSTTTSIVVGLVGADDSLIDVQQGIYMIMGANIGTTVTNTIVALAHFGNPDQLSSAFAGATVHDVFNFLTVAVLLPLEAATGYLFHLTNALIRGADTEQGEKWEGPAKKLISPLGARILIANKKVTNVVAGGGSCDEFYPISCMDPENPTKDTCKVGLIDCSKQTGHCPAFFDPYAGRVGDQSSGLVVFCIGLFLVFVSLLALVYVLTNLFMGVSVRVIYKATAINGYFLIGIGSAVTTMLQSSSTTTSFLVPVVGMGALRLEQMYPLTIGANLGTTISALLAALASDGSDGLQVALAHLMFNVTGMMIWYPIPFMRNIPLECSRRLGRYAKVWRGFTLVYLFGAFFLMPLIFLGLSALFTAGTKPLTIAGGILTGLLGLFLVWWLRWCYLLGGRAKFFKYLERKRDYYAARLTLPTDMERAKRQIRQQQEYAGLRSVRGGEDDDEAAEAAKNNKVSEQYKPKASAYRKARSRLARDMHFVSTGISLLYYHTGLVEDEQSNEDVEVANTASDEDGSDEPRSESSSQKQSDGGRFLQVLPVSYKIAFLLSIALIIWGLVELFQHEGKASTGGAAFVTVLLGLLFLSCLRLWFSEAGLKGVMEAFHNYQLRDAYLQRLPYDMMQVKTELKELLAHYRLEVDEKAYKDKSSSMDTSSSS